MSCEAGVLIERMHYSSDCSDELELGMEKFDKTGCTPANGKNYQRCGPAVQRDLDKIEAGEMPAEGVYEPYDNPPEDDEEEDDSYYADEDTSASSAFSMSASAAAVLITVSAA